VTLQRLEVDQQTIVPVPAHASAEDEVNESLWQPLAKLSVASEPGNERMAMEEVAEIVQTLHLSGRRLEQLKTAVAEATMNAMEHGNHYRPDAPVHVEVLTSSTDLLVRITDEGGAQTIPDAVIPDLEAKLAEAQSPRGWGLFLIKNLVDDMRLSSDETHHAIELIMRLEGESDASEKS
jgi:anti-sigma regulatory factor (Ser/Thr protein kinase)